MITSFKQFLAEKRSAESLYKSYVANYVKKSGKKITSSSRGLPHIRFPLQGEIRDFNKFFRKAGIKVIDADANVSGTFDTYLLVQDKTKPGAIAGMELLWVNNVVGKGTKSDKTFNTKELTPDALGIAGQEMSSNEIIRQVSVKLEAKYNKDVANDLERLMIRSKEKKNTIALKEVLPYNSKDLATISKDFGEILSGIWAQSNLGFKAAYFPIASNEKLIDFYGVRFDVHYPISVKSGGGGKVTIQNIIDAINKRAKTAGADHSGEKSLRIFNIVNKNSAKPAMIMLHQEMNTPAIKKLASIMKTDVSSITWDSLKDFLDQYTNEELKIVLAPFHKVLKTRITDAVWAKPDKMRFVISPLGESIWKILNENAEIKKSLTNVARQVTLIQVNIDVKKAKMTFKSNKFKEAEFQFGWAGYAAGNKLGFKMKLK